MINFQNIPDEMKTNGEKLAESTAQYEFLDGMTKTILSQLSPIEWSEASKEREARKDMRFINHLEWLKEARKSMLTAKTYQEALQARFEWYRSISANRRAEINLI